MVCSTNSIQNFNIFQIKEDENIQLDAHPRDWAGRIVACLNSWDVQIDTLFPENIQIQNTADQFAAKIKERFAPFIELNQWLEESGNGDWNKRLAESLVKLPLRSARNVVSYLYSVISNILYTAAHPLKGLTHIATRIVVLLDELTKPENWAKIGCGSIGALAGQSLVLGNPLSLVGLAIGGAVIVAGLSIDALDAAIRCEKGKEMETIKARLWAQAEQAPETLLTGFFTGMLIGGIRRAAQSTQKLMEIEERATVHEYQKIPGVAQYGDGDWSGYITTIHDMTLEEAKAFANQSDKINYFFHMKTGMAMGRLGGPCGVHVFQPGDAVFFSGEPWWGSAPGVADGYIKI